MHDAGNLLQNNSETAYYRTDLPELTARLPSDVGGSIPMWQQRQQEAFMTSRPFLLPSAASDWQRSATCTVGMKRSSQHLCRFALHC
jgi:myosin-crossreactive antigen